ncbi:unnamed protein product, partial [Echinostoma caproni]|uniref:Protein kinase domain-containing protein n=1 Tax=Echinostoma caproni TaxID=27848 RepID=A0A183A1A5_9TREM
SKVKFDLDTIKIPISAADVESNPPTDITIHVKRLLGQGANGFCHEVCVNPVLSADIKRGNSATRKPVLPRQCTLKVIPSNVYRRKREAIHREISVQKRVAHPNLLKLYMAYHDSRLQAVCLLLEFCALGSLLDFVGAGNDMTLSQSNSYLEPSNCSTPLEPKQTNLSFTIDRSRLYNPDTGGLTDEIARHIFRGIMRALDHLHDRLLIVHRDIKPSNIMLTDGWQAKLSDFGLACTVDQCTYDKR